MQFYHRVFSLNEAHALIFSRTSSDGECNDGDMAGGRVSGQDAETTQRCASFDRRGRRRPVSNVKHISHVVCCIHVSPADVLPRTTSWPRWKHALWLWPAKHVCSNTCSAWKIVHIAMHYCITIVLSYLLILILQIHWMFVRLPYIFLCSSAFRPLLVIFFLPRYGSRAWNEVE